MKKIISTALLSFLAVTAFSQATYYWTGGLNASWIGANSWNTTLGGGGTARTAPNVADILIFDGSNIGAGATGNIGVTLVQPETIASLRVQNGATVSFNSAVAGTSLSANISRAAPVVYGAGGNTTTALSTTVGMTSTSGILPGAIIITAGASSLPQQISVVTNVVANTSITITQTALNTTNGTAALTISQPLNFSAAPAVTLNIGDFVYTGTNANVEQITSIVDGTNVFTTTGTAAITAAAGFKANPLVLTSTTNALSVASGSQLTISSTTVLVIKLAAGAIGTVDGTLISGAGNQSGRIIVDADGTASLTFKSGSTLNSGAVSAFFGAVPNSNNNNVTFQPLSQVIYGGSAGTNGIFGAMYPASVVKFLRGSTFAWNGSGTGFSVGTNRELPNLKININLVNNFGPQLIDTLIIPAGITVTSTSSASMALKGDFINEGTFTCASATAGLNLIFVGNMPQRVLLNGTLGGGTTNYTTPSNTGGCFQKLIIAPNSTLTVQTTASDFNTYAATTVYGTVNFGTNVIKNVHTSINGAFVPKPFNTAVGSTTTIAAVSNSYNITLTSATNFTQGMVLSGVGVPANTVITNTATGNNIYTSNPVTIAAGVTVTASVNPIGATVTTANTGGLAASYTLQGTSTYAIATSPGTNYRFDGATTTPFPSTLATVQTNNLSLASDVSSNVTTLNVNGTLDLGGNTLTIPIADTVRIISGNAIVGSSAAKFIALGVNTTSGSRGFLRIGNIATSTLFPIGCNGNYLPVTITPAAAGEDYTISAFNGITADGTPNGTPFTTTQKAKVVDAVWTLNNNFTPTGNATILVGWPVTLKGSSFVSFGNQIGIAQYNTIWGSSTGTGNNLANTATASYNTFGAFGVGQLGTSLPVKFSSISASLVKNNQIKINWQTTTEINVAKYLVEASTNGILFSEKGAVMASNAIFYNFVDVSPAQGLNFYRIKAIDNDGTVTLSTTVQVSNSNIATSLIQVYPNPVVNNTLNINFSNFQAGDYSLTILNNIGQIILNKKFNLNASSFSVYSVILPNVLSPGLYHLKINGADTQFVSNILLK